MMTMMQDRWSPERGGEDAISWSERMSNGVASNCEGSTGEATRSDDGGSNQETGPVDESRGQECESQRYCLFLAACAMLSLFVTWQ